MKAGGGHAKGAQFEREVAKSLSKWISTDETDALMWRSSMSGGRATLQRRKGIHNQKQAGDLSPISAAGEVFLDQFLIECKFYKDLAITSAMLFGKGELFKFWHKLHADAADRGRQPMLVAKQNMIPTLVLLSVKGAALLYLRGPLAWSVGNGGLNYGVWSLDHVLSHPYRLNSVAAGTVVPPKRKIKRERLAT